jgi:MraZ protein
VQAFQRFYLAGGLVTEMDAQGRILVPQVHREHAKLTTEVIGVGMGEKLELWDQQLWSKTATELTGNFDDILAGVALLEKKESR